MLYLGHYKADALNVGRPLSRSARRDRARREIIRAPQQQYQRGVFLAAGFSIGSWPSPVGPMSDSKQREIVVHASRGLLCAIVLSAATALTACIYVPPVWDAGDEIHSVDEIEEGVTTREEVLDILGEPDRVHEDGNAYYYSGSYSDGFIAYGWYGARTGVGLIEEEGWYIRVTFDESGTVERVKTNWTKTSEEWSAIIANATLQQQARDRERCLMAVQGDKASQYLVAANYRYGYSRFPVDLVRSYLWYHYAARGEPKVLEERIAHLVGKMTPSQLAEAERLVAEWEPNPAECEALFES